MTTIGQIKAHNSAMGTDNTGKNGKICRRSRIWLNVAAPLIFVKSKVQFLHDEN